MTLLFRCIDCGDPVEEFMIKAATDPLTGIVDIEAVMCSGCDDHKYHSNLGLVIDCIIEENPEEEFET